MTGTPQPRLPSSDPRVLERLMRRERVDVARKLQEKNRQIAKLSEEVEQLQSRLHEIDNGLSVL